MKLQSKFRLAVFALIGMVVAGLGATMIFFERQAALRLDQDALDVFVRQWMARTARRIGYISLLVLGLGFIAALKLAQTLLSPIQSVVEGFRAVAAGRLDPLPESAGRDELAWMTHELNTKWIGFYRGKGRNRRRIYHSASHAGVKPIP